MEPTTTTLVFATDPLSFSVLAMAAVTAGTLLFFGYSYVRAAGWKRGLTLTGLRLALALVLGLVLLQPSLLSYTQMRWSLPESFTSKTVRALETQEVLPLLPPVSLTTPPKKEAGGDVYVESVVLPPMAFLKSDTRVLVEVVNEGQEVFSTLRVHKIGSDGPKELQKQSVPLRTGRQQIPVMLTPEELGVTGWRVSVDAPARDPDPNNNDLTFSLTVMRDSVRVLHLAGRPSWDVRFLREFLTDLAGSELVSFFLMVEAKDFAPHGREELSLIPFPIDDIFLEELGTFDVVILQNFPLGTYFLMKEKHLKRLAQYVESGGALLMIGGDQAFVAGRLQETTLASILPVSLSVKKGEGDYLAGAFEVAWSAAGRDHPATTAVLEQAGSEEPAQLPALLSVNPLGALKPGALELASAVGTGPEGNEEYPLVVAGNAGKGRVLLVATDSLWKWAFPEKPGSESARTYRSLLGGMVDWLTFDPRAQELGVNAGDLPVEVGQKAGLEVCPRGVLTERKGVVNVVARWVDSRGTQSPMTMERSGEVAVGQCAQIELPAASAGVWFVKASLAGAPGATGSAAVVVAPKRRTLLERVAEDVRPLLERPWAPLLADRTFRFDLPDSALTFEKPVLEPLWDHPAVFAILALLLLAEWMVRRRWGYL